MSAFDRIAAHLRALVASGHCLAGLLAHIAPDGTERAFVTGRSAPDGPPVTDPDLRFRAASITKLATGHAIAALAADGVVDLDAPIAAMMRWPRAPDTTLRALLSHTAGLTDLGGYLVVPPASLTAHVETTPAATSGTRGHFRYANLGTLLAAMAVERATGLRFDHMVGARVWQAAGIAGGLNWIDTDAAARAQALPMYQRRAARFDLEADGAVDPRADLVWTDGRGVDLRDYRPGQDTAWLSPHGGLRASITELARLARLCGGGGLAARLQRTDPWRFDGSNGQSCDGLFTVYGLGLTLYEDHPAIPSRLAGHAGNALGMNGGAWHNLDSGESWAYALTGCSDPTEGQDDEAFYGPEELAIMQAL